MREIRRRTRRKFAPGEKVRIVLEGLRGERSISESSRGAGADHGFGGTASSGAETISGWRGLECRRSAAAKRETQVLETMIELGGDGANRTRVLI